MTAEPTQEIEMDIEQSFARPQEKASFRSISTYN
jgi:hypothetical protein